MYGKDMSEKMKQTFQFVNVQGGVDSDVGMVDVTASLVNTPYEVAASAA